MEAMKKKSAINFKKWLEQKYEVSHVDPDIYYLPFDNVKKSRSSRRFNQLTFAFSKPILEALDKGVIDVILVVFIINFEHISYLFSSVFIVEFTN